jgi:hypothetical protein
MSQAMAPDVADSRLGRRIVGGLLWLVGPLFIKREWDLCDMIATIIAEDGFDSETGSARSPLRPS